MGDDIANIAWAPPAQTMFRSFVNTILEHSHGASGPEWASFIRGTLSQATTRQDAHSRSAAHENPEDICAWLDQIEAELDHHGHKDCHGKCKGEQIPQIRHCMSEQTFAMYQCSACGSISAGLKKCGRCGIPQYCDKVWRVCSSSLLCKILIILQSEEALD